MSAEFDFSASLKNVAPVSSMEFAVYLMRIEKSGLLMDIICVLFHLSSQLRSSSVSVVFVFNASLNDNAPVSPMLFPVDLMRMKKECIVYGCHLCVVSFCVNSSDRERRVLCLISMHHSMMLLLFL